MTASKSRLEHAKVLSEKSPAFKNFMRGLTNNHTLSDYTRYNIDFMKFHDFGENYDTLVKNNPKTISKMITEYLDSCIDKVVKMRNEIIVLQNKDLIG